MWCDVWEGIWEDECMTMDSKRYCRRGYQWYERYAIFLTNTTKYCSILYTVLIYRCGLFCQGNLNSILILLCDKIRNVNILMIKIWKDTATIINYILWQNSRCPISSVVEHFIRNEKVHGSIPWLGSRLFSSFLHSIDFFLIVWIIYDVHKDVLHQSLIENFRWNLLFASAKSVWKLPYFRNNQNQGCYPRLYGT